jgi:EmrB/QacA subfamily drug resistance transporter
MVAAGPQGRKYRAHVPAREHRGIALLALTLGVFLVTLNVTVVVVALPSLQADLHMRSDEATWVIDAYNLVGASLLLSAGFLADRIGRKRVLCAGYVLFAGGALACSLAPGAGWLIAFRVLQALGGTALTPTSLSIVVNLFPEPRERARAIGLWGIASGLGTGLGPIVGGSLTDWLGWRSVFAANAIVGTLALLVVLRLVPSSRSATLRRIDVPGQLLVAGFLATLTYALIEAPRYGFSSTRISVLFVVAALLLVAFVATELRVAEPLLDLAFFRDRQFAGAIVISGTMFFTYSGFIFFNALYLQDVRGYSALAAGLLTLPAAVPAVVGGPLGGYLVATRGPRGVMVGGTLGLALGVGVLALLPAGVGLGWLLASYLVIGAGYAVLNAPVSTVAVSSMPRDQAAVAAAVASASRNVGIVLGIAVLGTIVNGRVPRVLTRTSGASQAAFASFQHRYVDALHVAYGVAALAIFAAAVMAALTMRSSPPGASV